MLFLILGIALAAPAPKATAAPEPYKDTIEKALHLSLQHERQQAIQYLVRVIQKESKKGPPPKEILSTLEEVATVFYTDKAQQLFELAISLRPNSPGQALQRLNEALSLEPDQLSIQLEEARVQMILGECSKAKSVIDGLSALRPAVEEVQLLGAQIDICQGHFDEATQARSNLDVKKSNLAMFWLSTEADQEMKSGQPQRALEAALDIKQLAPQFPEAYYWQWRAEMELKKSYEKAGQTYMNKCKTLSARQFREYLAEPTLCRRVSDVEASLKKLAGDK